MEADEPDISDSEDVDGHGCRSKPDGRSSRVLTSFRKCLETARILI